MNNQPNPNELKPCPFCGACESDNDGIWGTDHHPECYIILMETEIPNSPLRIMAWNTRTIPSTSDLLSYIQLKADTHANASNQWKERGNEVEQAKHAFVSNECLDILDFASRHPEKKPHRWTKQELLEIIGQPLTVFPSTECLAERLASAINERNKL